MNFEVLLYYKFHRMADPQAFREAHQAFCVKHGLKGRVYVASEGLNGTVAGPLAATALYKDFLRSQPGLADIEFKTESAEIIPFEKMKTKVRPHILNMGFKPEDDVDPSKITGKHLSPSEWRQALESEQKYVLLDIRNNYESKVGHFKGAICPDLETFTQFPDWLKELNVKKDEKILMYCTGGIRCEKFSALLLEEGFQDVNQLHGGILNYAKEEGGKHYEGRCYVFDDRLVVDCGGDSKPIAQCETCGKPEDRYLNCSNMDCNKHFIACDDCAQKSLGTCSTTCFESSHRRPFDPINFRLPFRSKGKVFPELAKAKQN